MKLRLIAAAVLLPILLLIVLAAPKIVTALLFGGLIALFLLIRGHLFVQRFYYLADYISHYSNKKEWKSYLSGVGEEARFCFSVPVLLSLLCYIGGIF